jgi:hypothetical protein
LSRVSGETRRAKDPIRKTPAFAGVNPSYDRAVLLDRHRDRAYMPRHDEDRHMGFDPSPPSDPGGFGVRSCVILALPPETPPRHLFFQHSAA